MDAVLPLRFGVLWNWQLVVPYFRFPSFIPQYLLPHAITTVVYARPAKPAFGLRNETGTFPKQNENHEWIILLWRPAVYFGLLLFVYLLSYFTVPLN